MTNFNSSCARSSKSSVPSLRTAAALSLALVLLGATAAKAEYTWNGYDWVWNEEVSIRLSVVH